MYFETQRLSVGYSGKVLVRDISFSVDRGKILSIIGPNGAGKTTILKTISRHLEKITGTVTIENDSIFRLSNRELAKRLSVMLTERVDPELMTCGQVVAMGRYPYTNSFGRLTSEDRAIVSEALRMVRAKELQDIPFSNTSDGQRQRIMLARAICQQPDIMILDEPTSYLDIRHKIELLDILRSLATEKKMAIIMSLHEIDLAAKISDYIICVKGDTIENCGAPEEVFTSDFIKSLYDMEGGTFNTLLGSVELVAPQGEPDVFVLAGGGKGIPVYRQLQKKRRAFSTGVLFENDVDYQIASALSKCVVSAEAFNPVPELKLKEAKALIDQAQFFIDTGVKLGAYNEFCVELLNYAKERGKMILYDTQELFSQNL
ncbi:MAG TPA: ABC transporter ATP-binding protein [Clostridiales bacterium]|nr:ABC transporter ATP-binding protein [Clostridiales bacterium]